MPFRKEMNGKHAVTIQNNSVDMRHLKKIMRYIICDNAFETIAHKRGKYVPHLNTAFEYRVFYTNYLKVDVGTSWWGRMWVL